MRYARVQNIPKPQSDMPLNLPATLNPYTSQLEHLVKLAKSPGWKEYTWHRAKELDAHRSRIWQGIAEDLIREMKK